MSTLMAFLAGMGAGITLVVVLALRDDRQEATHVARSFPGVRRG